MRKTQNIEEQKKKNVLKMILETYYLYIITLFSRCTQKFN